MTGVLEKLFGSTARVKIMRLFLLNPESLLSITEISRRANVNLRSARREISFLRGLDFVKQKEEKIDQIIKLKKGKIKNKKKKISGLILNPSFSFLNPLKNLLLNAAPLDKGKMVKMLNSAGKMKLIVLAGIFIQSDNSRTDLFLVGDSIKMSVLERVLRKIEAETGKELVYSALTTKDFIYRMGMYDRFVRDILDYPHEKLVNKLGV